MLSSHSNKIEQNIKCIRITENITLLYIKINAIIDTPKADLKSVQEQRKD